MKRYLLNFKLQLYDIVVKRVPQIYDSYIDYKRSHKSSKVMSLLLLIKLNIAHYILHINLSNATNKIKLNINKSESNQSNKDIYSYIKKIEQYDIISFDIFDTLLLRPFCKPTDLFHLIGIKHKYLDFARIREEVESKLRRDKFNMIGNSEITIYEIYEYMEKYLGIDKEQGITYEIDLELDLCFPNPFMKEVYDIIRNKGKKILFVSDMYLPKKYIKQILVKCGYNIYDDIYISCEYGKSKHNGELFELVKEKYGKQYKYIHIGDNEFADVVQAKKHGIDAIHYPNVNIVGAPFRSNEISRIIGSAYKGIVNAHLHNGNKEYSLQYEYGYIYGGLFVLGYCDFIHNYVKHNNIDKVLFLSRDGDIIKQVYDKMYPDNKSEYVYWSRLAGTKLASDGFKFDYLKRFIKDKVNTNIKIVDVLKAMELETILSNLNLKGESILTSNDANILSEYLLCHWEMVQNQYDSQSKAGKLYYSEILKGCKKACAIDVGWAGSGAVYLDYVVNKVWNLSCDITGIIAGTNGKNSSEPDASEALLQFGQLVPYLYSQRHNRDHWRNHNPSLDHNLYFEALLCSHNNSFKGFELTKEGYKLLFSNSQEYDNTSVRDIQSGIIDFVDQYVSRFENYTFMLNISGSDAYTPFKSVASHGHKYFKNVLKDFSMNSLVGDNSVVN